jgi:Domain of unknown function (DUF427)
MAETPVATSRDYPQTACPYKGVTSGYWSVRTSDKVRDGHQDLAWAHDFPTRQLLPIAGLIAFYNEKIDVDVDGARNVGCPHRAQPEPDRRSRGAHPDGSAWTLHPRWTGSMTISRPAEVQAGCGAARGAERD